VQTHSIAPVMLASSQRPQLILKATLTDSRWKNKLFCFLPIVGALLFPVFGIPFEKDTYKLAMKLELYSRSNTAAPLWNFTIDEASVGYTNPYWYVTGPDQDESPERTPQIIHDLAAQGLQKALPDLEAFLTGQPNTFWHNLPSASSDDTAVAPEESPAATAVKPASGKSGEDTSDLQKMLEQIQQPAH
jgi:hypothetical protein